MKVLPPRACALLVLLASSGPALAQVLLPPADIPTSRRQQIAPRAIETDPQFEPGLLEEPDEAPQPPPQQPMRPSRGWNTPVERQSLPAPDGGMPQPAAPAVPQQVGPQQVTPQPGLPPGQPAQVQRHPAQPNGGGAASAPGIQTQTPPSPAGNVPPGSEDFVVVAPPPQRIENRTATFNGLDKITGRIIVFDAGIGEKVQFGALQVTPRACYTRPPNETPNTTGFLEVDEITLQGDTRRIFTGWMFAASPGLHAVEHAIYDVWLVDCKQVPPNLEAQTRR
ncbi:DUF2155 domain-containing protein [Blastochloris viridis]|uniref:DUF2155 domain-containing protein n=1 Tax=Blastochloris viridis TaxID=1079 RepID=A0A182DUZ9_BLAVI|nr:DUF2155 domain-containing protein [Blastochloris viridis]ALK08889.1 hypothetical protein BVIR_1100 [Blastochloris viridis]BAR97808.1 hypothetical protein BV133_215 [Blastochloris viridis]